MSHKRRKDTWSPKLAAAGVKVELVSENHYRATVGHKVADFWPTTSRWRDLGTGKQGGSVRELLIHFGAKL